MSFDQDRDFIFTPPWFKQDASPGLPVNRPIAAKKMRELKMNYSKRLIWLFAMLLTVMIAGCGGGKSPILGSNTVPPTGTPPPGSSTPGTPNPSCAVGVTIPTVTATDPTNGNPAVPTSTTGVANGGTLVSATFSLPMNASTINATSFTLALVCGDNKEA